MLMTVHIAIGNSDDMLSQAEWSRYVYELRQLVSASATTIHGVWFSAPDSAYQNACVGAAMSSEAVETVRAQLAALRHRYRQSSIAFNASETELI
ncbi:MAG: hypothetical protein ACRDTZ_21460 [Pseudonocardiaceae bacterium]